MISRGVIPTLLIVMLVLGIVPIISGIILLATKKLKGTAFWSGVGVAVIVSIILLIVQSVILSTGVEVAEIQKLPYLAIIQIVFAIINVLIIFLTFNGVIKGSRNFKGAVSIAAGYSIVNFIGYAMQMFSLYIAAVMIKRNIFDATYSMSIRQGIIDKETVMALKQQIYGLTPGGLLMYIVSCVGGFLMLGAISIFIVKGITNNKVMPNLVLAFGLHIVVSVVESVISNISVSWTIGFVISLAAFIYAVKIRGDIKLPEPVKIEEDSFMQSVVDSQNDTTQAVGEYNPYE